MSASTIQMAGETASDAQAAQLQTRRLASKHYENFSVVSLLLPRHLRQDFCNVYAFCRVADDLGDETGDHGESLRLLADFRKQTLECFAGRAVTPVFVALSGTIGRHQLPAEPFLDLIDAFEQDQRMPRYQTYAQVLDYCRRSANPVGRLVLYLCGYRDEVRQILSDQTCTALQLANFWQDVRRDILQRDRIYIPRDSMDRFGVTEQQIVAGQCDDNFRSLIRFEVNRTAEMFDRGSALLPLLRPSVRLQVSLFGNGGRAVLAAIRRQNYDTLSRRPALSKWQKGGLMFSTLAGFAGRLLAGGAAMSLAPTASGNIVASLPESRQYCASLTKQEARNFYYGLKLLPQPKRQAMFALYAYMRLVDDIADGDDGQTVPHRRDALDAWAEATQSAVAGRQPQDGQPIWPAFTEMVQEHNVPHRVFYDVIAGQRQDLDSPGFQTFDELREYCYRVAGVVGIASIYIWGFEGGQRTESLAIGRGIAFQLTNILRDLREDAARGRIYLPRCELEAAGVDESQLRAGEPTEQFRRMMGDQITRAHGFYQQSAELESLISGDSRPTLTAMTQIYHGLLEKMRADPGRVLRERVKLSPMTKFRIAWQATRSR